MDIESYSVTKGYCIIFDNYAFEDNTMNRDGSLNDSQSFKIVFESVLGYEVVLKYNQTKKGMIAEINKIRKSINDNILKPDPFVAIFLSHGKESLIRGIDRDGNNAYIHMREIMDFFSDEKCPLLKNNLKLFIISACRGGKSDRGVLYKPFVDLDGTHSSSDVFDFNENIAHQNFFVCYSTIYEADLDLKCGNTDSREIVSIGKFSLLSASSSVASFTSIRSRVIGTLFGSILSKQIELCAKNFDFEYILKLVQKEVGKLDLKVKVNDEVLTFKQSISWFANNISKKIYLTQFRDANLATTNQDKYNMIESRKGICLIFDLYDFDDDTILDDFGSHLESHLYKETFEDLGFETMIFKTSENGSALQKNEIESIIDENKMKPCSVFTMIFLSHGTENLIECSDGPLLTSRVVEKVCNKECKKLIGIPKILIFSPIYECQTYNDLLLVEEEISEEYNMGENSGHSNTENTSSDKTIFDGQEKLIPTFGDIIMCYSTINGEDTLRSPIYGTFYGSAFKSIVTKYHKTHHFEDLLKLVQIELNKGDGRLSDGSLIKQSTCWEVKGIAKHLYL